MPASFGDLFDMMPFEEPSARLFDLIEKRIRHAEIMRLRMRTISAGMVAFATLLGCIVSIKYFAESAGNSGLGSFLSLVFTDTSYAFLNWRDLVLSVLSALPVLAITIFLLLICAIILSVKRMLRYGSLLSLSAHDQEDELRLIHN